MTIRVKGLMFALMGLALLASGAQAGWPNQHRRRPHHGNRLPANRNNQAPQSGKSGQPAQPQAQKPPTQKPQTQKSHR